MSLVRRTRAPCDICHQGPFHHFLECTSLRCDELRSCTNRHPLRLTTLYSRLLEFNKFELLYVFKGILQDFRMPPTFQTTEIIPSIIQILIFNEFIHINTSFPNEIFYKLNSEITPILYFHSLVDMDGAMSEYARETYYHNVVQEHLLQIPFLYDMLVVNNSLHNSVKRLFKKSNLPLLLPDMDPQNAIICVDTQAIDCKICYELFPKHYTCCCSTANSSHCMCINCYSKLTRNVCPFCQQPLTQMYFYYPIFQ